ncbi:MAG: antibiotic biosynthesis monooxygenase [Methylobacteriaceae bacterium]|nr:antibiotic biosynthesis monooxygenase [Methylobacteriaceae bacterium]
MISMEPLDPHTPIQQQLSGDAAPVVLLNVFSVDPAHVDAYLAAWKKDAAWMQKQPGYISTQLHRAVGNSAMFVNYAVWETLGHFRAAFEHPEFKQSMEAYPPSVTARPHLFQKIHVDGICVA